MSNEGQCRRYLVSGRVQGVFYRASTRDQGVRLGLKGSVRNLNDGRVEVRACGGRDSLDALEEWLWQGPPLAQVTGVTVEPIEDAEPCESFVIS